MYLSFIHGVYIWEYIQVCWFKSWSSKEDIRR